VGRPGQEREVYCFGRFWLSPSRHALYLGETQIPLAPKSFEVLLYLIENPGRLVTKEELLQAVWADAYIEEANLAQQVFRLRKAFESEPAAGNLIRTMPGRGYQFTAEVTVAPLPRTSPAEPDSVAAPGLEPGRLEPGYSVERFRERTSVVVEEMAAPGPSEGTASAPFWSGRVVFLAGVALALACAAYWGVQYSRVHATAGGYRKVVVADFVDSTGNAAFNRTLKRALEIDLSQSPYLDVLSERGGVETLQLMGLNGDASITPDVGREICERTNREIMLTGTIAPVGRKYLLTLEGSDCRTGKQLASSKAKAATQEEVLDALDSIAEHVRRELNESAGSVQSYSVPLREATTSSLEALKAYSVGLYRQSQGKDHSEMIAAFMRAIELDPQFAMAYRELAVENLYVGQTALAAQYLQKAFDLSDHVSAREQLVIRSTYYAHGQGNLIEGAKAYRLWASTYPQDPTPLADETDAYMTLGQYDRALAAGEQAANLFPDFALNYENLSTIYRDLNRFDDAKRAANAAAQIGMGDTGTHIDLFEIASAQQDAAGLARENAWFDAHDDGSTVRYYPSFRASQAASAGRYKEAEKLFQDEYVTARRANLLEAGDSILVDEARAQMKLGFPEAARATLHRVQTSADDNPDVIELQLENRDTAAAERFLATHQGPSPDTILTYVTIPKIRARLALEQGKPLEAIAALQPAAPYELRDYSVCSLRAEAYQRAGQQAAAAEELRKIVLNPGIDPTSVLLPMAHLGLARAYASQREASESRHEYEALFALWKNSDPDLPAMQQARREYSQLVWNGK